MEKNWNGNYEAHFEDLKGKTIVSIEGLNKDSETVVFSCSDGSEYQMHYYEDCCARCSVEDIAGDLDDIVGSEILLAEEVSSREWPAEAESPEYEPDSFTWTFYKLATIKGSVTIRWYGSSNGYYSERVTFERLK